MLKKLVVLGVALIMIFTFMACEPPLDDDGNKELRAGFEISSGDPAAPYRVAYESDKTEFDIDDVTLRFSFAYMGVAPYISPDEVETYFHLFFVETSLNTGEFINTTPDHEYPTWVFVKNLENWHLITEIFVDELNIDEYATLAANSEEYRIPRDLFIQQQGCINFSLEEYYIWKDGLEGYGSCGGINIYYKVVGEKVILSATDFQ